MWRMFGSPILSVEWPLSVFLQHSSTNVTGASSMRWSSVHTVHELWCFRESPAEEEGSDVRMTRVTGQIRKSVIKLWLSKLGFEFECRYHFVRNFVFEWNWRKPERQDIRLWVVWLWVTVWISTLRQILEASKVVKYFRTITLSSECMIRMSTLEMSGSLLFHGV